MDMVAIKNLEKRCRRAAEFVWIVSCNGQIEEDGKNCQICGSSEHHAAICNFNGFYNFIKEKI